MIIARKIAYNVAFNATAKVISTVLALVGIGFITRYLGAEGFGNYATVLAFFSFFAAVADLGLYAIATREISRPDADEKKIMGNVFTLRIITSVIVMIASPLLILFLPYGQQLKTAILLAAAAFLFSSGYMVLNGIFQKNLSMDKVATAELIGKIIQLSVIIGATTMDWGFLAIVWALVISMAVNFFLVLFFSRRYLAFSLQFDPDYWKKFIKESWPMGVSVFITFLYFKMDTIMLSVLKDGFDVGIYNAAYKIIENITFFPAMIVGLMLPLISRFIFTDKPSFEKYANKTVKVFFLLIVPLIVGTLFLAEDIIQLIGGAGFSESVNVLRILIFALAFIFFGNLFNSILLAGKLQKSLMFVLFICAVFNISANLILIPAYSYWGAAFTSVMTELLVVSLTLYLVYKKIGYRPRLEYGPSILFSGLVMASFLFLFGNLNFFILAIGSVFVYFFFLWALKAISHQEITSIFSRKPEMG